MSHHPMMNPLIVIRPSDAYPAIADRVRTVQHLGIPVLIIGDRQAASGSDGLSTGTVGRLDMPLSRRDGVVLKLAGQWARSHDFSHLITFTASGFGNLPTRLWLCDLIDRNPTALIVGHREADDAADTDPSCFTPALMTLLMRLISGYDHVGTGTCLHVYPCLAFEAGPVWLERCTDEYEVLVRLIWAGMKVVEQPLPTAMADERDEGTRGLCAPGRVRHLTVGLLMVRQCVPVPHERLFNIEPDFRKFSWAHPLQPLINLHRRVYRKLDDNEQRLSLRHPIRSLRILHLERISPSEIALACFLGVFIGASPLLGFHTIAIFFYATRFRINRAISFYVSHPCAPVFPPFVPAWEIQLGFYFRNGRFLTLADVNTQEALFRTLGAEAHLRLWEYFLGWLVIGPLLALVVALSAWCGAFYYQKFFGKSGTEAHDRIIP